MATCWFFNNLGARSSCRSGEEHWASARHPGSAPRLIPSVRVTGGESTTQPRTGHGRLHHELFGAWLSRLTTACSGRRCAPPLMLGVRPPDQFSVMVAAIETMRVDRVGSGPAAPCPLSRATLKPRAAQALELVSSLAGAQPSAGRRASVERSLSRSSANPGEVFGKAPARLRSRSFLSFRGSGDQGQRSCAATAAGAFCVAASVGSLR